MRGRVKDVKSTHELKTCFFSLPTGVGSFMIDLFNIHPRSRYNMHEFLATLLQAPTVRGHPLTYMRISIL